MIGLSDRRYASLTSYTHVQKIFDLCDFQNYAYQYVQNRFGSIDLIVFYDIQLSAGNASCLMSFFFVFAEFMARTYVAVIRFASSCSSVLRIARKEPLLISFRISVYFASTVLKQFAYGSFGLMIYVNQHGDGAVNRVRECLVSLRYPREIM